MRSNFGNYRQNMNKEMKQQAGIVFTLGYNENKGIMFINFQYFFY